MAQLAIRGHETRGKEVIEILEMLGGRIIYAYNGDDDAAIYFIDGLYIMAYKHEDVRCIGYTIYTLEQFLEKYPYKVGDKVVLPEYETEVPITLMKWDGNEWFTSEDLKDFNGYVYKEKETMKKNIKIDIPKGYEFAGIDDDSQQVVFEKIKPQYPEYIKVGELKEMLSQLDDGDLITVTKGNSSPNYRISHIEDSISCGFYELRIV